MDLVKKLNLLFYILKIVNGFSKKTISSFFLFSFFFTSSKVLYP